MNQGKGIYLVNSREQLMEKLNMNGGDDSSARRSQVRPPQGRVIQRYLHINKENAILRKVPLVFRVVGRVGQFPPPTPSPPQNFGTAKTAAEKN